jgi:hypothetical protein
MPQRESDSSRKRHHYSDTLLADHREQVRAALWQFGGIIFAAARYLRVDPTRLRRYVYEIDSSLLEDLERIDAALTEYGNPRKARLLGFLASAVASRHDPKDARLQPWLQLAVETSDDGKLDSIH